MLALKNTLAKADPIPTLVFDEIDQGIGGRVGSVVGEKTLDSFPIPSGFVYHRIFRISAYYDVPFHVTKEVSTDGPGQLFGNGSGIQHTRDGFAAGIGIVNENISAAAQCLWTLMHESPAKNDIIFQMTGIKENPDGLKENNCLLCGSTLFRCSIFKGHSLPKASADFQTLVSPTPDLTEKSLYGYRERYLSQWFSLKWGV